MPSALPAVGGRKRPGAERGRQRSPTVAAVLRGAVRDLLGVRPRRVVTPRADLPLRVPAGTSAVVVGGGIAGTSAAVVLAERGVRVTLLEAADHLGGRLGAWPHRIADGSTHRVEHGFHGFFRQYYTWRAVLRRVDPELGFLRPIDGYPVISRAWPAEDFASLPGPPPLNLAALILRSPSLRLADLRHVDRSLASALLEFDRVRTYAAYDRMTAAELLDRLAMPDRARAVLFEVFSHSFFNREDEFSAAEMIMLFHFYFLGNPEGLGMDAPEDDSRTCIWDPLAALLDELGADVRVRTPVRELVPTTGGWRADDVEARHIVLAVDPASLRRLLGASPAVAERAPELARQAATLTTTAPYADARYRTDRPVAPERAVFSGVSRESTLDSVTVYSRLEAGSARWARDSGGDVLELHAYAAPDGIAPASAADRMWTELGGLWPEVTGLRVLDRDARVGQDAPGFPPGSDASRPAVRTDDPGLLLAGDWVRLPFPSALMERAAVTGVLAAGDVLAAAGARAEPVEVIRPRGLLRPRAGNVAEARIARGS